MKVTLIGCGCGPDSLTAEARHAIEEAELLIGPARLLESVAGSAKHVEAVSAQEIRTVLDMEACERICVLFSGDCGFYSGAQHLLPMLPDCEWELLPGISSMQLFAARLALPWQNWKLCSAHGRDCDPVAAVCDGRPAFFLTGGRLGPAELCRLLSEAGLGALQVSVGEMLGTASERILHGTAADLAGHPFSPLCVMLADAAPQPWRRSPGIPDSEFLREEKIPMTKQETRALILSKLAVLPEDCCWDIGAGSGSVAVELALQAKSVWAVERDECALELLKRNRERFGAWKLRPVAGTAPDVLCELPKPDVVFIGGSGGNLNAILRAAAGRNPSLRICVSAIAPETLIQAYEGLKELGFQTELTQISVARSRPAASLTLMLAQNPVWLITGIKA